MSNIYPPENIKRSTPKYRQICNEMKRLGAPVICAVWDEDRGWIALEGSHRIAAAHELGIAPKIRDVTYEQELSHSIPGHHSPCPVSSLHGWICDDDRLQQVHPFAYPDAVVPPGHVDFESAQPARASGSRLEEDDEQDDAGTIVISGGPAEDEDEDEDTDDEDEDGDEEEVEEVQEVEEIVAPARSNPAKGSRKGKANKNKTKTKTPKAGAVACIRDRDGTVRCGPIVRSRKK